MYESLDAYCRRQGQMELLLQWHPTKNKELTPATISYGTKKKVWWICQKGHEWQATIHSRAREGTGCPVCAGKIILPGVNDLASAFPELAAEWHTTLNVDLRPDHVSPFSNRKVWWTCEKGHEYQSIIAHRTRTSTGCPYCAGRKVLLGFNDLASNYPAIAAEWHPILNGELTAQMITYGSHKKVWWICSEGHVWKSVVYSRTDARKCGCPVCAGRVKRKKTENK